MKTDTIAKSCNETTSANTILLDIARRGNARQFEMAISDGVSNVVATVFIANSSSGAACFEVLLGH